MGRRVDFNDRNIEHNEHEVLAALDWEIDNSCGGIVVPLEGILEYIGHDDRSHIIFVRALHPTFIAAIPRTVQMNRIDYNVEVIPDEESEDSEEF